MLSPRQNSGVRAVRRLEVWGILLFLLFHLTGCALITFPLACLLKGNGEGYCGNKPSENTTAPSTPSTGQDPNLPPIGAERYFWVQKGYTCTTANGTTKTSHRDSIDVLSDGTYRQNGDLCATQPGKSGPKSELDIFGNLLGFGPGIYQKGKP